MNNILKKQILILESNNIQTRDTYKTELQTSLAKMK